MTIPRPPGSSKVSSVRVALVVSLALALLGAAVFRPVTRHGFIHWDDGDYIFDNGVVRGGLSPRSVGWAFTTGTAANWHPLTWISHMADVELYGLDAGRHHLTSLLMHLASTVLLFLFLGRSTGSPWRAALVAALFAVHPLHVESVAWAAERKDVLSGLFWMLTLLAWLAHARRPGPGSYTLALALFALGLMAKPMLVSLPLVLILLDFWPLGRLGAPGFRRAGKLIAEKLPFFLLAAASSVVTLLAQWRGDTVVALEAVPLGRRLGNAVVSYVLYLRKTILPSDLAFLYPYPAEPRPAPVVVGAALALAALTFLAFRASRRHPALAVGWLWYLLTLVPVIGLVQVGVQAMADRYTYLPLVGIFLAASWSLPPARRAGPGRAATAAALAVVVILAVASRGQVRHWKDDLSLFGHAVRVDPANWLARNDYGDALALQGRLEEAVTHFSEAVRLNPGYAKAWCNLGLAAFHRGRLAEAQENFRKAVGLKPLYTDARNGLAAVLLRRGRPSEALVELETSRRFNARDPVTFNNLGAAWLALGDAARARESYREALRLRPGYPQAGQGLAAAEARLTGTVRP